MMMIVHVKNMFNHELSGFFSVRCKQRAQIGLEIFYGDNRDDTHMFQMIKAKDVVNHILRKKV